MDVVFPEKDKDKDWEVNTLAFWHYVPIHQVLCEFSIGAIGGETENEKICCIYRKKKDLSLAQVEKLVYP